MASDDRCGFCARARADVQMLIAGPLIYFCDTCVSACVELATDGAAAARALVPIELHPGGDAARGSPCGFCGKYRRETRFTFVHRSEEGHERAICDECVGLCMDILGEVLGGDWAARAAAWPGLTPLRQ
jgi:ATP-dependent protease Clp ATPase subunit